ncbi:MAG: hypothetical protein ACR2QH_19515, partial [Geminicoccaceae bacterium]
LGPPFEPAFDRWTRGCDVVALAAASFRSNSHFSKKFRDEGNALSGPERTHSVTGNRKFGKLIVKVRPPTMWIKNRFDKILWRHRNKHVNLRLIQLLVSENFAIDDVGSPQGQIGLLSGRHRHLGSLSDNLLQFG